MKQRRRLNSAATRVHPMLAAILTVAVVATAAVGGQQILQVQSVAPASVEVYSDSASFDGGANITVNDAAVRTQSGEQEEVHRVVKEFTRDREFSLFALTWSGERDIVAFARSQRADGTWTPWYEMEIADSPNGIATFGTEPIYVERTKRVQVSTGGVDLLEGGRTASAAPTTARDLQAVFIDGGVGTTAGDITPVADSYSRYMPKVVTRAQWGAKSTKKPYYTEPVTAVTVHHTAGSNNYTAAEAPGLVRGIEHYHAVTRGWGDIGYNALVDKYGNIYEGRAGGLDRAVQGAHVGGFNTNTWGVSVMGDYSVARPTTESIKALGELIGWKAAVSGFDPTGSSRHYADFTFAGSRYAAGQGAVFPNVNAHRDFHFNDCPGDNLYARMGDIRRAAKVKYDATRASRVIANPALPSQPSTTETVRNPDGTTTTVIRTDGSGSSTGTNTTDTANLLQGVADGDAVAIATVVGTVAGAALIWALQNGKLDNQVKNVAGTELIAGLTVQDVAPVLGPVLSLAGSSNTADVWKKFEPELGKVVGSVSGVGGQQMVFYANGIGVRDSKGEIFTLAGQIANAWLQQGLDAGPLGMPKSKARNVNTDEVRMDFEGGSVVYSISKRKIDITTS
ncbi:N-acetylmuramoyl-L-alanine amidase [Corynebacterium sp. Q4381]|uniref:peptidoglycan recognition protein family protein n=1 Tax=Corynebacterium sp. Marseille-Q4381 TaxID=3121597 RepID=UPI002FE561ED